MRNGLLLRTSHDTGILFQYYQHGQVVYSKREYRESRPVFRFLLLVYSSRAYGKVTVL